MNFLIRYMFLSLFIILSSQTSAQVKKDTSSVNYEVKYSVSYVPAEGKIIGIWPTWEAWRDTDRLNLIKDKYGFQYIGVYPVEEIFNSVQSVYDTDIMLVIPTDNPYQEKKYEGLWGYYIDEPDRNDYDLAYMKNAYDWVHQNAKGKFYTGDYRRSEFLKTIADQYSDGVLFTSYKNWNRFLFWWIPGQENQSDSWTDMKNIFKEKFFMTWVNGYTDVEEYNELFSKATELNIKGLWLYCHHPEITTEVLDKFCEAAVTAGFMKRIILRRD